MLVMLSTAAHGAGVDYTPGDIAFPACTNGKCPAAGCASGVCTLNASTFSCNPPQSVAVQSPRPQPVRQFVRAVIGFVRIR